MNEKHEINWFNAMSCHTLRHDNDMRVDVKFSLRSARIIFMCCENQNGHYSVELRPCSSSTSPSSCRGADSWTPFPCESPWTFSAQSSRRRVGGTARGSIWRTSHSSTPPTIGSVRKHNTGLHSESNQIWQLPCCWSFEAMNFTNWRIIYKQWGVLYSLQT